MKKNTAVRVLVVQSIIIAMGALLAGGCGDPAGDEAPGTKPAINTGNAIPAEEDALPVFATLPEFTLTDQAGTPFGTEMLLRKAWVANFIFTRCMGTCPIQTAVMSGLQEELKRHPKWRDIRLVSISVDPDHDTPEVLRAYAEEAQAEEGSWAFLTGSREEIWNLSEKGFLLPVGERPEDEDMPLFHSSKFILVDRQNRIRGYYDGLAGDELGQLKIDLDRVLKEPFTAHLEAQSDPGQVPMLDDILAPPWLEARQEAQLGTIGRFTVFHDFKFSDQLEESGIEFMHRVVDDSARNYKGVHYDHGSGVSIADVDGDGLYDLYFVNQVGSNQLWRNLGGGKFEDMTAAAGVAMTQPISVGSSFADIDNDGDPDLYVTTVRGGNFLFENDGTGKFRNISAASGLDYNGYSSAAVFFDFNRDGLLDLFLVNVGRYTSDMVMTVVDDSTTSGLEAGEFQFYAGFTDAFAGHLKPERAEQSILFKNMGNNRFSDVSAQVNLQDKSWSGDASPLDVNEDGWIDLYVLNMEGHDEYYENVGGKYFVKKSRELFPSTSWGAMGIKVFDYNNDGRMDIFITDMHSEMSEDIGPAREKLKAEIKYPEAFYRYQGGSNVYGNSFFRKEANGEFREISDQIGVENYWPWGLSVGDLNADGYEDVFIASSMNFPFRYGINSVLLNNRGQEFLDSEFILGVEPRRGRRTAKPWFELQCSGADAERRLCEDRSGDVVFWGALGSRSSVIFDLDNDGDLDIVTNDFNSEPMVLVSNLSERTTVNFLKVKLTGAISNRDGLGATVKVRVGSQTFTKVHDGQSGHLSQSLFPLYFGLGEAKSIDEMEILWPSGRTQVISGPIGINTLIEVKEQ